MICVADDPAMHSSQNEQDSRHYALAAKVPMLEPADSGECYAYAKAAYELSEKFDTPVILRVTTRIAHSQSIVEMGERNAVPVKDYVKNPQKYIMMPAMAKKRHPVVEQRTADIAAYAMYSPPDRMLSDRQRRNHPKQKAPTYRLQRSDRSDMPHRIRGPHLFH